MPESDQYFDRVAKVIAESLGCSQADVTEGACIVGNLGADSLDLVELVMALEKEFDIEIPDADADGIYKDDAARVRDVVTYVREHPP